MDQGQANAVKVLIMASTAAIVIAGDIYGVLLKTNERVRRTPSSSGFLIAMLLPTIRFALDVYGSLLFGLTAAAWLPVFVSGGVLAFYDSFARVATLVTSMIGASSTGLR